MEIALQDYILVILQRYLFLPGFRSVALNMIDFEINVIGMCA